MKKSKTLFLILTSVLFISLISINALGQGINDRTVKRENYVIRFPDGGPDLQFFLRSDENKSNTQYRYTLKWSKVIEYTDEDGNGIYNKQDDTEVSTLNLDTLNFDFKEINSIAPGTGDESISGKQFNFSASFTQNSVQGDFAVLIGWWDDDVQIPYAEDTLEILKGESKFTFAIHNWQFESPDNRLALLVEVVTTTPLKNYYVANLPNGTFGLLTRDNEDGKGHRGGIINNPTNVEIDGEVKQIKTSVENKGVTVDLQYNFPSFSESLFYDPAYSAVSTDNVPTEFEINDIKTDTSGTAGIPGFNVDLIFTSFLIILIVRIQKGRKRL